MTLKDFGKRLRALGGSYELTVVPIDQGEFQVLVVNQYGVGGVTVHSDLDVALETAFTIAEAKLKASVLP